MPTNRDASHLKTQMFRLFAAPRLQRAEAGGAGAGERRRHGRLQRHPPQQRRQRPLRQHPLDQTVNSCSFYVIYWLFTQSLQSTKTIKFT